MNCKSNKTDCAAYVNNGCAALQKHAERNNGKCPFYRSKKEQTKADADCLENLIKQGKQHLIELYRGKRL